MGPDTENSNEQKRGNMNLNDYMQYLNNLTLSPSNQIGKLKTSR